MKVSTDACILGAWAPAPATCRRVLDVGAGTGLLSLMMAQRLPKATIEAVECEPDACQDAQENFNNSAFAHRLKLHCTQAQTAMFDDLFDYIICNPPFFTDSLLSPKPARNLARHSTHLSRADLLMVIRRWLSPQGMAAILLPASSQADWQALLAAHNWHIHACLNILPTPDAAPNRVVSCCSPLFAAPVVPESLIVRDHDRQYSQAFRALMEPFYLYF